MTKKSRRVAKARRALLTLSLVLVVAIGAVGGTIAWLTSVTTTIENTFTVGDITINLDETKYENGQVTNTRVSAGQDYDLTPGNTYKKDPIVTVAANSEPCYLFVQFVEENNTDSTGATILQYTNALINTAEWTELPNAGVKGKVYWREVGTSTAAQPFPLITETTEGEGEDAITYYLRVNKDLSKTTMPTQANAPKLTYQAFAVQTANHTETSAWDVVKGQAIQNATSGT